MKGRRVCLLAGICLAIWAGCSNDGGGGIVVPPPTPPRPVAGLYVRDSSPTRVWLAWRDASETETGFRIERQTAGDAAFAEVDTTAAGTERYFDTEVTSGQTYRYRVIAYLRTSSGGIVDGTPSDTVQVRAGENQAPSIPTALTPSNGAVAIDPNEPLVLRWTSTDPDADPLRYDVRFGSARGSLEYVSRNQTDTTFAVPSGIADLKRNSAYFWQVTVHDAAGVTRPSPVFGFTTLVDRVVVPLGEFVMGEPALFPHPGSPVTVSDFSIDRYEVTSQQYASFLNQARERGLIEYQGGIAIDATSLDPLCDLFPLDPHAQIEYLTADSVFVVREGREPFPMVEVSWFGAQVYAKFYDRRLPTEAEWEKAARGTSRAFGTVITPSGDTLGIGFPWPWGSELDATRGNFANSGDPYENAGLVYSTPVGFYDGTLKGGYQTGIGASSFDVEDLAGNVWEWTADWYGEYTNPHRAPNTGQFRVIRGGSYRERIESAVTYNRSSLTPTARDRVVGFRTASQAIGAR